MTRAYRTYVRSTRSRRHGAGHILALWPHCPRFSRSPTRTERELVELAYEACTKAYAPYSKFQVGAAITTTRGTYTGANVENGSYGLTCCAERNAVFAAVSCEGGKIELKAVAVYALSPDRKVKTASPCGACARSSPSSGAMRRSLFLKKRPVPHDDRRGSPAGCLRAVLSQAVEREGPKTPRDQARRALRAT